MDNRIINNSEKNGIIKEFYDNIDKAQRYIAKLYMTASEPEQKNLRAMETEIGRDIRLMDAASFNIASRCSKGALISSLRDFSEIFTFEDKHLVLDTIVGANNIIDLFEPPENLSDKAKIKYKEFLSDFSNELKVNLDSLKEAIESYNEVFKVLDNPDIKPVDIDKIDIGAFSTYVVERASQDMGTIIRNINLVEQYSKEQLIKSGVAAEDVVNAVTEQKELRTFSDKAKNVISDINNSKEDSSVLDVALDNQQEMTIIATKHSKFVRNRGDRYNEEALERKKKPNDNGNDDSLEWG